MDFQSLVAAHMRDRRPPPMSASAEDRYYSGQFTVPRLRLRLLGLIATTGGAMLLLAGIALA